MTGLSQELSEPDIRVSVRRTGLASILFAILRPGEAKAASVNADRIKLAIGSRTCEIALGDIQSVEARVGRRWTRLQFRHAAGTLVVSGLSRTSGHALVNAVETARTGWWRRALAPRIDSLRSLHDQLTVLADPRRYVDAETFDKIARNARTAIGDLAACWPHSLTDTPEIRTLRDIMAFLEAPEDVRSRANETFVASELARSRSLFDQIETSPLTEEQRKAVVIDDRRNLVIAAAGSGKTSVIVAKAGWLVRREFRKPSELLLLAFARDARNEMEERVRKRLGTKLAPEVTVRTFHSLGMEIIGKVEGKRPALARTAETERALFDQLRHIFTDLLKDSELSETVLEWFQGQF